MANAAITVDLNARIAQFETELKRATGTLDRFEKKGSATLAAFKSFGAGLVGALSVGAIAGFVKNSIDAQDAISKLSQKTGIAVESLAGLQHAANLSDVSVDQLAKGVRTFSVLVDEAAKGSKSYQDKLASLGVDFQKIKNLSPEDQFFALADAVSRLSKEDRAAAVAGALGDRMSVLVPLLSGGSNALRQMVEEGKKYNPVTEESALLAEQFNDNITRLKASAGAAGVSIATNLLPSLATTAVRVRELLDKDKGVQALVRAFAGLGKLPFDLLIGDPFKIPDSAPARIKQLKSELGELTRDLKSAQQGGKSSVVMRAIFGTPEEIKQRITVIRNQIAALEKFGDKVYTPKQPTSGGGADNAAAQLECVLNGGVWDGKKCRPKPTGGSKSDPLAGLLGQTDIGRLAAFDKQVALLNARFDGGRKSTELYNQAMTNLVETTFAANFAQFTKDLAEQDETQRLVADHLKATNDELFQQQQAWTDAGRALEESMRTPLENANIEFGRLQELLDRGVITWETYTRAVLKTQDAIDGTPEKLEELDTFAKKAAENIQDSFADFLFDPFDNGLKGMLQGFGDTLRRIIAEAAAADIAKSLFGDLVKGGSGSGFLGGALTKIGDLFGFANGGVMTSAGPLKLSSYATGGIASSPQLALFGEGSRPEAFVPLPDGRNIPVRMQGGGGNSFTVIIQGGQNAPDVRRAAAQGMREGLAMVRGAQRYA